jgi:signal transduction histidine kinase
VLAAGSRLFNRRLGRRYAGGLALLVALYYGSAHLGYALRFAGPVGAIVWLPVGVAIAFLFLAGIRFWPGVVVGDLLVNNYSALPTGSALGQTAGNLLEVVVATVLLDHLLAGKPPLRSIGGVARMTLALAAGTAVSATIGTLSLRLGSVITPGSTLSVWRNWWLGDFAGALVVVPLVLAWSNVTRRGILRQRWREALLAPVAIAALSVLALRSVHPLTLVDETVSSKVLGYLVFPALFWSAVRLGQRGATAALALAAGFAIWGTTHYTGPFAAASLSRTVLETQLFIVVASVATLCLGAAVEEREQFSRRLWASRVRLVAAADTERRRLRQDLHDGAQQRLTALLVRFRLAAEQARETPSRAEALFEDATAELSQAIDELRELAHGDRPAVLVGQGLAAAMRDLAERSTIETELEEVPASRLPENVEAAAYFVLAEAVANAQKHARAASIHVRAGLAHGFLHLSIADDGIGGAVETEGSGLQGLRDRVEALGGTFALESPAGEGTRLLATIPHNGLPQVGVVPGGARRRLVVAPRGAAPQVSRQS